MTENTPNRDFIEMLLEQDSLPEESTYSDHRKQIDQRLQKAKRDEKIVRITTIAVFAGALCLPLFFAITERLSKEIDLPAGFISDVLIPMLFILLYACWVLVIPLLILYVLRYRRALDRSRENARDTVLLDLQQRVAQLSKALHDKHD
jgi:hypothetical protein